MVSAHGLIDSSEVHQTRIRRLTLKVRVTGQTAKELCVAAVEKCDKLFGDTPYVITDLDVEEARNIETGEFQFYDATAWAEAP